MRTFIAIFAFFLLPAVVAHSQELRLPFKDDGACPFECCQYREWSVLKGTKLRTAPERSSQYSMTVRKGATVTGVTGFVMTERSGSVEITKPTTLTVYPLPDDPSKPRPERTFQPGEILSSLSYAGEGGCTYWLEGKKVLLELFCLEEGMSPPPDTHKVISSPKTVWWVKIRAQDGEEGWTEESGNFGNQDACG